MLVGEDSAECVSSLSESLLRSRKRLNLIRVKEKAGSKTEKIEREKKHDQLPVDKQNPRAIVNMLGEGARHFNEMNRGIGTGRKDMSTILSPGMKKAHGMSDDSPLLVGDSAVQYNKRKNGLAEPIAKPNSQVQQPAKLQIPKYAHAETTHYARPSPPLAAQRHRGPSPQPKNRGDDSHAILKSKSISQLKLPEPHQLENRRSQNIKNVRFVSKEPEIILISARGLMKPVPTRKKA